MINGLLVSWWLIVSIEGFAPIPYDTYEKCNYAVNQLKQRINYRFNYVGCLPGNGSEISRGKNG